MGSGQSKKEALELIASPENKEELEKLFKGFDKDKNGSLDRKEWKEFGKLLYQVDVEQANAAGREEVRGRILLPGSLTCASRLSSSTRRGTRGRWVLRESLCRRGR